MLLASNGLEHGLHDPALADPGFPDQQDHLTFTGLRLAPAFQKQSEFLVPTNNRQHLATRPGCKPALAADLAAYCKGRRGRLDSLEKLGPEIDNLEQAA